MKRKADASFICDYDFHNKKKVHKNNENSTSKSEDSIISKFQDILTEEWMFWETEEDDYILLDFLNGTTKKQFSCERKSSKKKFKSQKELMLYAMKQMDFIEKKMKLKFSNYPY